MGERADRFRKTITDSLHGIIPEADIGSIAYALSIQYTSPTRYYHNEEHIAEFLSELQNIVFPTDRTRNGAILAALFHDSIYHVHDTNQNEAMSSMYMRGALSHVPCDKVNADMFLADNLISATKPFNTKSKFMDCGYHFQFLDIDWLRFSSREKFEKSKIEIIKEYELAYSLEEIMAGTMLFYNNMLSKNGARPFNSEHYSKYNDIAEELVRDEIQKLTTVVYSLPPN